MIAEKLYSVKVQVNFVNPLNPRKFLKEPKDLYRVQPKPNNSVLKILPRLDNHSFGAENLTEVG